MQFSYNNSSGSWDTQLDPQERTSYAEFFRAADTENKGVLLKDEAIAFFKKANIPANIINEIWEAADREGKGFLTDQEFCIALKLIACAQHGIIPASPVLTTQVPLPQLEGIYIRPPIPDNRPSPARGPASPNLQPASNTTDSIPPDERAKYISLFQSSGPVDGVLIGERAKDLFSRSNLPNSTLGQIWALADTRKSGALNQTEFIIAMHYITQVLKGNSLPPSLPATVYAAAASGRVLSPVMSSRSPTIRRQGTVSSASSSAPFTGEQSHHPGRGDFDVSEDEFAKYKVFFEQIDTRRSGFISGNEAVVFFRHSKLPESDLARIWDLADTRQVGQLNLQQFAVAMHLINRRLAGGQIPTTLTDPTVSRHPSFMNAHITGPASPSLPPAVSSADLLGFSGGDAPPHASPRQAQQPSEPTNSLGTQLAGLESTLSEIRIDTRNQIESNELLRSQVDTESQAIRQLQETIARENEALEALKRAAADAERELEQKKHKKTELTQELQVLKQEKNHYQKRLDTAQSDLQMVQSPVLSNKSLSPEIGASSINNHKSLFGLSAGPSSDLFGPVSEHRTRPTASLASPQKTFDPYAGFKESKSLSASASAASSPIVSLDRLKEDTDNRHMMRSVSPNVDISAIEAKFPDLTTMEHSFQPTGSTSSATSAPAGTTVPVSPQNPSEAPQSPGSFASKQVKPFTSAQPSAATAHASSSFTPKQSFASVPQPALSPSQAKSVAKYGFDLSAFEDSGVSSSKVHQRSVKDDLTSLLGSPTTGLPASPTPATASATSVNTTHNFDDIFGVSSPSTTPSQATSTQPEKKPTFDEMFF